MMHVWSLFCTLYCCVGVEERWTYVFEEALVSLFSPKGAICALSHWGVVYPVRGVAIDSSVGVAGSEIDMEADMLWDVRLRFCTTTSSSGGDKLSSHRWAAGAWGCSFRSFFSDRLLPPCTAAQWQLSSESCTWNWPELWLWLWCCSHVQTSKWFDTSDDSVSADNQFTSASQSTACPRQTFSFSVISCWLT